MYQIIDYFMFTFKLFATRQAVVAWLILLILYSLYLFGFCEREITVKKIIKIIAYPFMFVYGVLMCLLADITGKSLMKTTGTCILIVPILLEICVFVCSDLLKEWKNKTEARNAIENERREEE